MGQGGHLWIVNATGKVLKRVHLKSYQMNDWKFSSEISANSSQRFYVEFDEGIFKAHSDDAGEVVFELEGTGQQFEVKIRWIGKSSHSGLSVDWKNVDKSAYYTYPGGPGEIGHLGWIHNGSLCMVVIEKGFKYSLPNAQEHCIAPKISNHDIGLPKPPGTSLPIPSNWMEKYQDPIGKLTLLELTLPGSHDSGTYYPEEESLPIERRYVKTQSLSLHDQLLKGIRVLDLRIGQKQPGDYVICHAKYETSYTLHRALKEVTSFIDSTSKEVVVLDFHYFHNLGHGSFDYTQLKSQVSSLLNGYCVTYAEGHGKTLNDILGLGHKKRVIVAWNDDKDGSIDKLYMWPGVSQHWYDKARENGDLLHDIKHDFSTASSKLYLWSSCVFTAPAKNLRDPEKNAYILFPDCDNWFFGCSELSNKANIISTDFFHLFNNVINASIIANLLKAAMK